MRAKVFAKPLEAGACEVILIESDELETSVEIPVELLPIAIERLRRDEDGFSYAPYSYKAVA